MPTKWTPEEDALIQKLREEGFTAREITVRVKRSEAAIKTRFSFLKIRKNKSWTPEEKEELLRLRSERWSIRKLAAHYGVSERAIEGMLAILRG